MLCGKTSENEKGSNWESFAVVADDWIKAWPRGLLTVYAVLKRKKKHIRR